MSVARYSLAQELGRAYPDDRRLRIVRGLLEMARKGLIGPVFCDEWRLAIGFYDDPGHVLPPSKNRLSWPEAAAMTGL